VLGLAVLGLCAAAAMAMAAVRQPPSLNALAAALFAALAAALLLFAAPDAGQSLAVGAIVTLVLLSAANASPEAGLPARAPWRLGLAAALAAIGLAALALQARQPTPEPPGAYLSRRALSEFQAGASGVQAALLSFRLTWVSPAAAALALAAAGVWAVLRQEKPPRARARRGAP